MSGVDFREYVDRLAYQLINSDIYGVRTSAYSNEQESVHARNGQAIHTLKPLYTLPAYGEKKRKCAEQHQYANIVQDDAALSVAKRQHFSVPPVMSVLVVQSWLFAVPAQGVIA